MLPRGIRNNNPLNIRRSKDQWKGMAEAQTDGAFVQFKTLEYGLFRHAPRLGNVSSRRIIRTLNKKRPPLLIERRFFLFYTYLQALADFSVLVCNLQRGSTRLLGATNDDYQLTVKQFHGGLFE